MWTNLIGIMLCTALSQTPTPPAGATPAPRTTETVAAAAQDDEVHMVPLQHAACADVRETLRGAYNGTTVLCDDRTNSIIWKGPKAHWDRLQTLIAALDKPANKAATDDLLMLSVASRSSEDIARRIAEVLASRGEYRGARIAADSARSMLLLSGPPEYLDQAARIAKQLDTPARTIRLELAFLHAYKPSPDVVGAPSLADSAVELPGDLADVGKELERFGKVRLLGRFVTVAVEGEKFSIAGNVGDVLDCEVRGRLGMAGAARQMRLELSAQMDSRPPTFSSTQPLKAPRARMFDLSTTLTLSAGQTMVLGTAPTGWSPGESAILVVRVVE